MLRIAIALTLIALPAAALADPDPGPGQEGCGFLPLVERYLLLSDNPCYLEPPPPPPAICYDPQTQQQVVCSD